MRFFGNTTETVITNDDLTLGFIVQSVDFTSRFQFEKIDCLKKLSEYQELDFNLCVDLEIPEEVLDIIGYN